jgi:magnesium-protoporphyrin O-methyltransferase
MAGDCCPGGGCSDYDRQFDERHARAKLAEFRRDGPRGTTAQLVEALAAGGVEGSSILEVGAGVGAVHLSLLERGAAAATDVDASRAYVAVAREEAERRGLGTRVRHIVGDFADAAPELAPADIVALDRVVCCYGDVVAMVASASRLTLRRIGLVYPVDRWWVRAAIGLENAWCRLRGDPFRAYVHATEHVDGLIRSAGLVPVTGRRGWIWQLAIYERPRAGSR